MSAVTVIRKATPVLIADRIEPALAFWKKLGLTPTTEVPDASAGDGRLAFAILAGAGVEVMYQTEASLKEDLVKSASESAAFADRPQTILYVEVARLAEVASKLQGERLVMPQRTTFYGSTELGYADPAGNIVVFAEHRAAPH